jgi:hypothetical protein
MQFIFLSSFPSLTKPKHWTPELQRQLAVKRGDRMLVNFPHCKFISFQVEDDLLHRQIEVYEHRLKELEEQHSQQLHQIKKMQHY